MARTNNFWGHGCFAVLRCRSQQQSFEPEGPAYKSGQFFKVASIFEHRSLRENGFRLSHAVNGLGFLVPDRGKDNDQHNRAAQNGLVVRNFREQQEGEKWS